MDGQVQPSPLEVLASSLGHVFYTSCLSGYDMNDASKLRIPSIVLVLMWVRMSVVVMVVP
jgi:hypothetical protein